ncbi:CAP domain-containing protein [Gordonia pseudamarae]|uniref:CAP domain-containing protein n=1 Tax=Gordonia pseudamarae TaxID=2831662 RepID=A0ABX6IHW5_9ACTN|nr:MULTISPECIES: CAP domain-containing protein [Gordonia]MBD0023759.1 CAP domain-containing protein [Gordonia sp. (in: high G+C Gram-positive bacteria)]QHN26549.1 CAP domain-containing protein [Gordonia pseudamarae]QHN35442.1 CAP domain-containing protein [Gordonia pseudamarae]
MRRIPVVLGAVLALVVGLGVFVAPAPAEAAPSTTSLANSIHGLTNTERTTRNLGKVGTNACLKRYAQSHSQRQARENRMYHQQLRPILNACGVRSVGENVAYGYPTARAVMVGWMNSPGHRANILKRGFNRLGVGVAYSTSGRPYYTQVFGQI